MLLVSTWMGDRWQMGQPFQPPRLTQPGQPSVGSHSEYERKLGLRQAHRAMH